MEEKIMMHRHWLNVVVRSMTLSMDRDQETVQMEVKKFWNFPMKLILTLENYVSSMMKMMKIKIKWMMRRTMKRKVLLEVGLVMIMIVKDDVDDVEEID